MKQLLNLIGNIRQKFHILADVFLLIKYLWLIVKTFKREIEKKGISQLIFKEYR